MKRKLVLLNLILVFLLIYSKISCVGANGYGIGIQNGQELIWKCNVCNQLEMDIIFGNEWNNLGIFENLSKGRRMKWRIDNIELDDTFIKLNISEWRWTKKDNWGNSDNNSQIVYLSNPDNYDEDMNFSNYPSLVPLWFPVPVGEYLGELKLNQWYDIDNRVLPTLNVEIEKHAISAEYPSKNIKIIAIYNNQGILNSYKLYTKGNVVIIDISFQSLPHYVIPTLIGLALGLSLSLIMYIIKKRRTTKFS